jgi:hypothetical protein
VAKFRTARNVSSTSALAEGSDFDERRRRFRGPNSLQ